MGNYETKSTRKFSLKNRLLSVFQYKTPNIEFKPSLAFEKSNQKPETGPRIPQLEFQNYKKQNLRHIKSLPPHQVHLYSPVIDKPTCLVSVSTQTDSYSPGHREVMRLDNST